MSRDFKVALAVVLVFATGLVVAQRLNRPSPGVERQRLNLLAAEEELPRVVAVVGADQRFKDVRPGVYTGQEGGVCLIGFVESDDDLFRLMRAIADARLRVTVAWNVQVLAHPH